MSITVRFPGAGCLAQTHEKDNEDALLLPSQPRTGVKFFREAVSDFRVADGSLFDQRSHESAHRVGCIIFIRFYRFYEILSFYASHISHIPQLECRMACQGLS
jgi:hypothetical protein